MAKKIYIQPQTLTIGMQPSVIMGGSDVSGGNDMADDGFNELSRKREVNTGDNGIWKDVK